jgi:hypothetical protein
MAETSVIRIRIDAGVVDQQIYRFTRQHPGQLFDLRMIRDIQRMQFYQFRMLSRQLGKRIRFLGMAAASQYTPAICGILTAKFQSDAAVGAGDQCGSHCGPLLLNRAEVSLAIILFIFCRIFI